MQTFLVTKKRKGKSSKAFIKRFQSVLLWFPSCITQATLVETCRDNMLATFLVQMRVVELHTCKQLKQHDEQTKEIVARV